MDAGTSAYVLLAIDKVASPEMRLPVTVTVYNKSTNEPASQTFTYSVESFAYTRLGSAVDTLVKALMKFGDSADAYFNYSA